MSRKSRRIPYQLYIGTVEILPAAEIAAILRAADPLIMEGGRTLLAKILKGSREKKLLELQLDETPTYGYYKHLPLPEVMARVDWAIARRYLAIEYVGQLPMLVYTPAGWEIERETFASELLQGFDRLLESGAGEFDMAYLKDRNRGLILLLLDKVEASGDRKYLPILEAWAAVDYKKVKERIRQVAAALEAGGAAG